MNIPLLMVNNVIEKIKVNLNEIDRNIHSKGMGGACFCGKRSGKERKAYCRGDNC